MYEVKHRNGHAVTILEIGDAVTVLRKNPVSGEQLPTQLIVSRPRKHQDRSKYRPSMCAV